MYGTEANALRV